jgi:erythromycin esterase-like protein
MAGEPIGRRTALTLGLCAAATLHPLASVARTTGSDGDAALLHAIEQGAEPLPDPADPAFGRAFDRFGAAQVVLLGEATHGTAEFYEARAAITRHLVREHGFTVVALEADWPDAAHIDAYIRGQQRPPAPERPFRRFPTWMWRNDEMRRLVDWLREHNGGMADPARRVGVFGLDLYGLAASMEMLAAHLAAREPAAGIEARRILSCLSRYNDDFGGYAADALRPGFDTCEDEVARVAGMVEAGIGSELDVLNVRQNARAVVNGERYYRTMSGSDVASWNLRDWHMVETLERVLEARGPDTKAVVWAHNSHVGDASATEMGRRGEHNVGQLCRRRFGEAARLIGFGTDRGTVMAASRWGGEPTVQGVRPSLGESYGGLFRSVNRNRFLLDLRRGVHDEVRRGLARQRPERAIGVLYLPQTERVSHYFQASLPEQFDAYVWFEETRAVTPVPAGIPGDHPLAP